MFYWMSQTTLSTHHFPRQPMYLVDVVSIQIWRHLTSGQMHVQTKPEEKMARKPVFHIHSHQLLDCPCFNSCSIFQAIESVKMHQCWVFKQKSFQKHWKIVQPVFWKCAQTKTDDTMPSSLKIQLCFAAWCIKVVFDHWKVILK